MTFLVNLMFRRFEKFDGPIFGGAYIRGAYVRDANRVTYLGAYIWGGGSLCTGGRINGILRYVFKYNDVNFNARLNLLK